MKKLIPALFLTFFCSSTLVHAAADSPRASALPAGEIFGKKISREEFDFAYKTTGIFSVTDKEAKNDAERRSQAWQHLVFLKEAETRGIEVSRADVENELARLLAEKQIKYGSYNYLQFIKDTFKEEPKDFERRIENLLKVKKMIDGIMHPPAPVIKDEDAKQKYLNQYNSMNVEFINVPTLEEAQKLYKSLTKKKWDEEKKKNPKFSTPTGHISLEAHIDLWKLPKEDAYRIHSMAPGEIAAPAKMYKGYGVYRLTDKKDADPKEYTDKKREEYIKVLTQVYYYEKTQKVIQDIINAAAVKDYDRDKVMIVETSQGTFELQLYTAVAPKACENFMRLAEKGYYNGLTFHRVIKGFMIQSGDPNGDGSGGKSIWREPFDDEVFPEVQFEKAGILAMANSGPNTNGSQFFITVSPQPNLNMKHTIFGEVITGYEVVKKISEVPTTGEGHEPENRPLQEQKIIRISLKKWL